MLSLAKAISRDSLAKTVYLDGSETEKGSVWSLGEETERE